MDIISDLQEVIDDVKAAKPVPLSASAMINRESLVEKLERIQSQAPEELKQARWLMRDREELLAKTQTEAEKLVDEARVERDRLLAKTEIVAAANREADKLIEDAKARARQIRMEAEDYVDGKLANFEVVLQKTLAAVAKGRESLRGRLDAPAAASDDLSTDTSTDESTGSVKVHRPN